MTPDVSLFSDAELAEDPAQQVIRRGLPGDFAQGLVSEAQFLGQQLTGTLRIQRLGAACEVRGGTFECGDVAGAGAEGAFAAGTGAAREFVAQGVEAGAGEGGDLQRGGTCPCRSGFSRDRCGAGRG